MAFLTDKQTLNDLGIFNKPGNESVFSLFNRTCTSGGAALLEEMFNHPLSTATDINERITIFSHFKELNTRFPFQTDLFGFIEHYMENRDERTKLNHEHSTIGRKIIQFVASDSEYKSLQKGVACLCELLTELWQFLQSVQQPDSISYAREKEWALGVLQQEPFSMIVQQKKPGSISAAQVAEYDTVFRFRNRNVIAQLMQFIYKLDVFIAVATVANEKKLCLPRILPGSQNGLIARDVYHLLLKKPVANSIDITAGSNMVFLTGANMAGKSTLMKTIGIAVFLAHMGFPVPAQRLEFSVLDGLYTTINLSDNLGSGTSHFYAEVMRIKKVAKELALSKNLFVIFDELFRGTNVKDAYEATIAVITAFAQKRSSLFVISTHIIEAGEVLKETCPDMQFLYLPTRMQGTIPVYTYTLESGITNDRHGMIIIQNEGILEILSPLQVSPFGEDLEGA